LKSYASALAFAEKQKALIMKARPIAATLFIACCLLLCGLILRRQIAAHPLLPESAARFGSAGDRQEYGAEQGWRPASTANAKEACVAVKAQLTALRDGDAAHVTAYQTRRLNQRFGSSGDFLRIIQVRRPELTGWQHLEFGPVWTDSAGHYARATVRLKGKAGDQTEAMFLLIREGGQLKIDRLRTEPVSAQSFPRPTAPAPPNAKN